MKEMPLILYKNKWFFRRR